MKHLLVFSLLWLLSPSAWTVDMPLTGMNGEVGNLTEFRGKWVVVNYWATWCPPCIEEMPELQAFHDKHADDTAVVVGINNQVISSRELESFLDIYMIDYPMYLSDPAEQSVLGAVPALPTTFLVSPQGEVVARQVGQVTGAMIEAFIAKWKPE